MEYIILLITHVLKSVDYFAGMEFPIADFLTTLNGLVYWLAKLMEIYSALI